MYIKLQYLRLSRIPHWFINLATELCRIYILQRHSWMCCHDLRTNVLSMRNTTASSRAATTGPSFLGPPYSVPMHR